MSEWGVGSCVGLPHVFPERTEESLSPGGCVLAEEKSRRVDKFKEYVILEIATSAIKDMKEG